MDPDWKWHRTSDPTILFHNFYITTNKTRIIISLRSEVRCHFQFGSILWFD